jgi:hypothetical protein
MEPDTDADAEPGGTGGETTDADGSFDLHSIVVRYEDGPDRCTVYPSRDRCVERTTEWLSADADAFVDLTDAA